MTVETKTLLSVLGFLLTLLVWGGGIVGTYLYSLQPGNSGGIVFTLFVGCMGWGFVQESRQRLGEWCS